MKYASIDAEYNQSKEPKLNLVCIVIRTADDVFKYWVHNSDRTPVVNKINELHRQGYVFISYAATAEARVFLALNLEPLKYKWVDNYLEYRQLLNHNHKLQYGRQYMDGRVKTTKPPVNKWEQTEEEKKKSDNEKPRYNLAAACFKLLNVQIDTVFKENMRKLIISNPVEFTKAEQEEILQYCADDTEYLWPMFQAMLTEYKRLLGRQFDIKQLIADMKVRAEFSCRTAKIESLGYPINVEKTKNFSDQVGKILFSCQQDIIRQFPDNSPFYKFKRKEGLFTMNQSAIRDEIRNG